VDIVTPTIGVLCPGDPAAPSTWSGTPSGVVRGLAELGVQVRGIDVEAHPTISSGASLIAGAAMVASIGRAGLRPTRRRLQTIGSLSPAVAAMRSAVARRQLRGLAQLDALIQIGTGYSVTATVPIVTFEDMTIVQAREAGSVAWRAIPARAFAARVARQRDAYQRARACCATTHWAASSIVSDYGVPADKVHVVGVGRNFEPRGEAIGHNWAPPRFLFVGLDWERKNGPRLLVFAPTCQTPRLTSLVPTHRYRPMGW